MTVRLEAGCWAARALGPPDGPAPWPRALILAPWSPRCRHVTSPLTVGPKGKAWVVSRLAFVHRGSNNRLFTLTHLGNMNNSALRKTSHTPQRLLHQSQVQTPRPAFPLASEARLGPWPRRFAGVAPSPWHLRPWLGPWPRRFAGVAPSPSQEGRRPLGLGQHCCLCRRPCPQAPDRAGPCCSAVGGLQNQSRTEDRPGPCGQGSQGLGLVATPMAVWASGLASLDPRSLFMKHDTPGQ